LPNAHGRLDATIDATFDAIVTEDKKTKTSSTVNKKEPKLTIIIPVHNEQDILVTSVTELMSDISRWREGLSYELILAENGSEDSTLSLAQELGRKHENVRVLSLGQPNYGAALRQAILMARGEWIICDEIDLCDVGFYRRAIELLEEDRADLVVGSKAMPGARDQRPLPRKVATRVINGMLKLLVGFSGTDTHGLKAFRRDRLLEAARRSVVDKDLFASEFVIRAEKMGVRVMEIPVEVAEKRRPSVDLVRRVPNVLKNLATLFYVLRIRRDDD
jgi:glycosyltransferase involved in cell wall biosynthesis